MPDALPANASMPSSAVVPVLHYEDVERAAAWLCRAFGFRERLRVADHRVQLETAHGGHVVVAHMPMESPRVMHTAHAVMVRVADADAAYRRARDAGARLADAPLTHPYGERQFTAIDFAGHHWIFSQTMADVDPADWGGVVPG